MSDFETELGREQNATETAGKMKNRIKRVAENKGLTVETTDTPLTVLTKLDNGTIPTPTETINITSNGTYDVTNYASANVNVPSEEPTLGTKTITANGTYNASDDNLDGYSSVTVNVTSGGSGKFATLVDRSITQVTAEDLSGVTSIGQNAFQNCTNLTGIEIPSSVTSIGENAFFNCSNLTSIVIPSSVTIIDSFAFYNCDALATVTFEENSQLGNIKGYAFQDCSSLTSIEIPGGVTSIGGFAFQNCTSLSEITVLAETPPTIQSTTFRNVPNIAIYYVPDTSVETYKTATNWSTLATQIQPLSAKPTT